MGYNSTQVIFKLLLQKLAFTICDSCLANLLMHAQTFMIHVNKILGYQFRAPTRLRLQAIEIHLKDKYRVGTPIR